MVNLKLYYKIEDTFQKVFNKYVRTPKTRLLDARPVMVSREKHPAAHILTHQFYNSQQTWKLSYILKFELICIFVPLLQYICVIIYNT